MAVVFYEGRRIYLRAVEMADEARVRVWLDDPANWRTLDHGFPFEKRRRGRLPEVERSASKRFGVSRRSRGSA